MSGRHTITQSSAEYISNKKENSNTKLGWDNQSNGLCRGGRVDGWMGGWKEGRTKRVEKKSSKRKQGGTVRPEYVAKLRCKASKSRDESVSYRFIYYKV